MFPTVKGRPLGATISFSSGMPAARKLIDYLREVNSCPEMQVMCCGGIYKRAEGLAEEIGADLFAPNAADAVRVFETNPARKATVDQQTVGRTRRIRKAAARTFDGLMSAIGNICDLDDPAECWNYFRAAGYAPE